jgi:hypothetical protein
MPKRSLGRRRGDCPMRAKPESTGLLTERSRSSDWTFWGRLRSIGKS